MATKNDLLDGILSQMEQWATGFKVYTPRHLFIQRAVGILAQYVSIYDSFPYYPLCPSKTCKLLLVYWATGLFSGRIVKQLLQMETYIDDYKNNPFLLP